jgi:hypothetical protein
MIRFKAYNLEISQIENHNFQWVTDVEENFDALVVNITDENFHIVENCIKKSIPVFIVNLYDLSFEKAQKLFKLSTEAESIVQVNSPLRFENQTKDIIDSYGKFKIISFRKSLHQKSADYFKELLFNEIDSFISISKSRTRKIYTYIIPEQNQPIETIDCRIELDNGIILKLLFSTNFPIEINQIELFGKNLYKVISYKTAIKSFDNFNIQLNEFKDAIINNIEPKASIEDGLTTLRILNEIFTKLA